MSPEWQILVSAFAPSHDNAKAVDCAIVTSVICGMFGCQINELSDPIAACQAAIDFLAKEVLGKTAQPCCCHRPS